MFLFGKKYQVREEIKSHKDVIDDEIMKRYIVQLTSRFPSTIALKALERTMKNRNITFSGVKSYFQFQVNGNLHVIEADGS